MGYDMDVAEYAWKKTEKIDVERALDYLLMDEEGWYNHPFVEGLYGKCFLCADI